MIWLQDLFHFAYDWVEDRWGTLAAWLVCIAIVALAVSAIFWLPPLVAELLGS